MIRITNFQIYCLLLLTTTPLAYLVTPMMVTHIVDNNSWLAILTAIIPGALLIYVYIYILKNSIRPFPALLEDCLGSIIGKIIGFFYIFSFLFGTAVTLRYFVALIGSSTVPDTPLSIFIGAMLLVSYYALKTGMANIARVGELLIIFGLPIAFFIILISLAQKPDFNSLLPFKSIDFESFTTGIFYSFYILGDLMAILILAYFSTNREKIPSTLFHVLYTYIILISLTAAVSVIQFGSNYNNLITFPTFKMVRTILISDFIQNIDVVFIAIWIIGMFAAISVKWFLACYTIQQLFGLRDYRFLAAPSSVAIGIISLMMGRNIIEVQIILHNIMPIIYSIFYIFIPLIIFFILLFKPNPGADIATGIKNPVS
ncbi:MAG: endospore germination permease [Syntrophomonas sp.]|nr:endospore germination permease [Syntrophomonas sp.]